MIAEGPELYVDLMEMGRNLESMCQLVRSCSVTLVLIEP